MRRAGGRDGQITESGVNTADGSMAPSKASSETGDDSQRGTGVASPTDSNLAKDKSAMTREERETKYRETRERIFGPENENVDSNELENAVSRTSSRNEKKKKKHKNNDDGFQARSQFTNFFPPMQYPVTTYDQTAASPAYYSPYTMQQGEISSQPGAVGAAMLQQGYQQGYNPISTPTPQGFPAMAGQTPLNVYDTQTTNGHAVSYNQQMSSHYYPSMQQSVGIGQPSPVMSPPAMSNHGQFSRPQSQLSDQQWAQNTFSFPYPQQRDQQQYFTSPMQNPNSTAGIASVPYQYGQLPLQPGMQGARAQHPLPGSYKSQAFNPQSRNFVPNGASIPPQPAQHGNNSGASTRNSNDRTIYCVKQLPHYHQGPSLPVSTPYNFSQEAKAYATRKSTSQSNVTHSPVQSSLSKWGTPSHLPPKPPPPEVQSMPDAQHSLPLNNQFNVHVQPLSGGQQMPSFQNGVYSMPGVGSQAT